MILSRLVETFHSCFWYFSCWFYVHSYTHMWKIKTALSDCIKRALYCNATVNTRICSLGFFFWQIVRPILKWGYTVNVSLPSHLVYNVSMLANAGMFFPSISKKQDWIAPGSTSQSRGFIQLSLQNFRIKEKKAEVFAPKSLKIWKKYLNK